MISLIYYKTIFKKKKMPYIIQKYILKKYNYSVHLLALDGIKFIFPTVLTVTVFELISKLPIVLTSIVLALTSICKSA